jgi:hypothetical protein
MTEVDRLRDEILQTRAELGGTVEALVAKADVRARRLLFGLGALAALAAVAALAAIAFGRRRR